MQKTRLQAKVAARNNANRVALELAPKIQEALAPFVGQKVLLAAGGKTAKVKAVLEPFTQNTIPVSVWVTDSHGYSLVLRVKTCEPCDGHSCAYMEACVYLGDLDCGRLARLSNPPEARYFRTDYTEAEVVFFRSKKREAEATLSRVRSLLDGPAFGDHDAH